LPTFDELFPISIQQKSEVEKVLNQLTIEEKVGQMFFPFALPVFRNKESIDYRRVVELCTKWKVGGFVFFRGTVYDYAILGNELQRLSNLPLIFSADFERGTAMRVDESTSFPYAMAVAASQNLGLAEKMGEAIAEESLCLGIHNNFAPVADINTDSQNPIVNIRGFSDNREVVSNFAQAYARGLQNYKFIATAKHFPGHGRTNVDSHRELPVINCSKVELMEEEMFPFINLINGEIRSVMIGHLAVPSLENNKIIPATFSKRIVTDLLIKELDFNGLIISDALNMYGATNNYSVAEGAKLAIQAGVDILILSPDTEIAIKSIIDEVKCGTITEERINFSVKKILYAKMFLGLFENRVIDLDNIRKTISAPQKLALSQKISDEAITVAIDKNIDLPISKEKKISILTFTDVLETEVEANFNTLMYGEYSIYYSRFINPELNENKIATIIREISKSDLIIVPLFFRIRAYQGDVLLTEVQLKLISEIEKLNQQKIFISFGDPYIINKIKIDGNYISAFGDSKMTQRSVVKGLKGEINFKGKLPIKLFEV